VLLTGAAARTGVQAGLDERGLAGAARARQQHVVGRAPLHELARVLRDLLFLAADVLQVFQRDVRCVQHRLQMFLSARPGTGPATPAEGEAAAPLRLARHGRGQHRLQPRQQVLGAVQELVELVHPQER
jgi:hypothetical protein